MDDPSNDFAAFVLAGGKSTRMGTDKAFVTLGGETLLAKAIKLCRSITPDVRIVGDQAKFSAFAPVVRDIFPGCGPLAAIHAALCASSTNLNLILAVDTPFITSPLLQFLVAHSRKSNAVVTVVRTGKVSQPLCAIYRREFANIAESALRAQRYKIDPLFDVVNTRMIGEDELSAAGFSTELFRNLNTPEDLAEASRSGSTT